MMYSIKLFVLCYITLNNAIVRAFPQNWPSSSDTNSGFDWKQKGASNKNSDWGSYSSDEDLESISSEVLEKNEVK